MADLIENCRRRRGMIGLLSVLGALLLGVRAQQQEFRLVGSDVTLVPKYTGDLIEIKWMFNDVIFVEIVLKPQEEIRNPLPNNRATINNTNGALTIRNLTTGDSGVYEAQVILMDGSSEITEIRLTVRDCPDQPTISVQSTKDWFVVSCESFSPDVTYEWFNPTTSVSKSQLYAEPKKNGTLTCVVDNKVCNKRSSINFYIPAQREVKSERDDVTLVPQYTGDPSEIIWKVNGDDLVVMVLKPRGDIIFHRLQDRATISHTDGSLTIRDLKIWDTGVYTAEVLVNNEYYYTERRLTVLESSRLSGCAIIAVVVIGVLVAIIFITIALIFLLWDRCCRKSERCITVMFWNDVISLIDESEGLLEGPPKRIQSLCLTIHQVQTVDDGIFTNEAVGSDGKPHRFTEGTDVKKMVWKKDDVTQFEWAVSSLKFHASNLKLEPGSVTVYNAEGKESYIVFFRLEEHPESKSICCITFHPSKMTGIDPSTWKKDSQPVNIRGDRFKCDPNGDLTIYDATSEDKGKYTVQCKDKKLDQEFILQF